MVSGYLSRRNVNVSVHLSWNNPHERLEDAAEQTSRCRSLLLPRTNLFGGGRPSFRNTEPPLLDIFVERLRKASTLYNGRLDTLFNPYCLSFQDKIRLLQDDLESERELRQRVSSINVFTIPKHSWRFLIRWRMYLPWYLTPYLLRNIKITFHDYITISEQNFNSIYIKEKNN